MPIKRENNEKGQAKEVESSFPAALDLMRSGQEKKPANLLSSLPKANDKTSHPISDW